MLKINAIGDTYKIDLVELLTACLVMRIHQRLMKLQWQLAVDSLCLEMLKIDAVGDTYKVDLVAMMSEADAISILMAWSG